jgi:DNA-binding MarR family transcriptional regulator
VEYRGRALPPVRLPGLDFVEQTCWDEFLESSIQLFAAIDYRLKQTMGLTLAAVRLLNYLDVSNGSFRKSQLSHALMLNPSRVGQLIRHLKPQQFVTQSATPNDPRGIRVSITDTGRARLEAARQIVAEEVRAHYLGGMSRHQMTMLTDSHRRINLRMQLGAMWETYKDLV